MSETTLGEYKAKLAGGQQTFTPVNGPQDQEIKNTIANSLSSKTPSSSKPTTQPASTPSSNTLWKPPTTGGNTISSK